MITNQKNRYKTKRSKNNDILKKRIALIGFRGIGKTTISKLLAKHYKKKNISMDDFIEKKAGQTISSIVKENGWGHFRFLEKQCLEEITKIDEIFILDCGGGIVESEDGQVSEEKIQMLKDNYFTIYLYMTPRAVFKRLSLLNHSSHRPALADSESELNMVYERRMPLYKRAAHAIIDISDTTPNEAVHRIVELIKN